MSEVPRTTVELVDKSIGTPTGHVAMEVRINGTPVAVAEDGVQVEFGAGDITSVTVRLLPTEVRFIHAEEAS